MIELNTIQYMTSRLLTVICIRAITPFIILTCGDAHLYAGLNDIRPRPQQMGLLAVSPLVLDGAFTLVMPDNPTAIESFLRDEAVAELTALMGVPPVYTPFSQWTGQAGGILIGTPERFPALVDSLLASGIPGLGVISRDEEYQLLVGNRNIFLAGKDHLGMEWGLFSLVDLMGQVNGQTTVDRAYVRDWPDLPKRVCTVNTSVRIQSQFDYADSLFNFAYHSKMNEIEWNDQDGGNPVRSNFANSSALELRQRIRRRGQFLTMGVDRTGLWVPQRSWQEGVPIVSMPMTVGSTGFTAVSYGISATNGGFESWTNNRPNSWEMYPESNYSLISRDNVTRHSGSSSIKWANMTADYPGDRTVRQKVHFGPYRLIKAKFWYKTSNFSSRIRVLIHGDDPVNNHFENQRISVPANTDWTQLEVLFSVYHDDSAEVWIGPNEYSTGTLWIDDLTFENAGLTNMIRRADTPLRVYKQPGNTLMTEGVDYSVTELSTPFENFVTSPKLTRINGGALSVGNQVTVDWYTAILYQTGRMTVCWSMLEPLEFYQQQIRNCDSLLAPHGFKIHINEVTLANYDQNCTSRGMTPGQLVGAYVNQMYNIIQARRPGVHVRSYGDAFDVWVKDNRCQPVTTSPWTVGALQQVNPNVEMMVMTDYSRNMDSSCVYFNDNGSPVIIAYYGTNSFQKAVQGAVIARRAANCTGMQIYDWDLGKFQKLPEFASLGWNLGPFFVHTPPVYSSRPDTVFLTCEMWTDSFTLQEPTSITSRRLTYRFLPGGNWTTITPAPSAPRSYSSALIPPGNATSLEYYFVATDHREQTRSLPPDAPSVVYRVQIPESVPNNDLDLREYNRGTVPRVNGQLIEWDPVSGAEAYEVHLSSEFELCRREQTLLVVVPATQTQFYVDDSIFRKIDTNDLRILPIVIAHKVR